MMRLVKIAASAACMCLLASTAPTQAAEIIYNFPPPPGFPAAYGPGPSGPLVQDSSGALYGVTIFGGINNQGTVFKLVPPAKAHTDWTLVTLYEFQNVFDGYTPNGSLTLGPDGSLFGATASGGAFGETDSGGTIFQLTPPPLGQTSWTKTILHSFATATDGTEPQGNLVKGPDGALYGSAAVGGLINYRCDNAGPFGGCGTIFRLEPPSAGSQTWGFTVLIAFDGVEGAGVPGPYLVLNKDGSLFGTNSEGAFQYGQIFKLFPTEAGWKEQAIFKFLGGTDGLYPVGLIKGPNNTLYGTTVAGGLYSPLCNSKGRGCGTVFSLQRPGGDGTPWTETVIHRFAGRPDAAQPNTNLVMDQLGTLYGTTNYGGSIGPLHDQPGVGTVFSLSPPVGGQGVWTEQGLGTGMVGDRPNSLSLDSSGTLRGLLGSYTSGGYVFALPSRQLR